MIGFVIKKIISALIMPLSIGLIFAIVAIWYLYKQNIKRAKIFLIVSVVWISIVSYLPFATLIMQPLESRYSKLIDIPKDVKYILLLGGDMRCRAWEVVRLYQNIPNAKIITSGYSAGSKDLGAEATARFLTQFGIKREDIITQQEPNDTAQEAIEIKKRLKDKPFILVTSAYHMPRAMEIFKKEGLNPIPAPTDYKIIDEKDIFLHVPKGKYLLVTEQAWHEYIGLLWIAIQ
jgi:uncharacterized SAM-binding protein YcdF (DUF218 family)